MIKAKVQFINGSAVSNIFLTISGEDMGDIKRQCDTIRSWLNENLDVISANYNYTKYFIGIED